jgi:hypothetical protein
VASNPARIEFVPMTVIGLPTSPAGNEAPHQMQVIENDDGMRFQLFVDQIVKRLLQRHRMLLAEASTKSFMPRNAPPNCRCTSFNAVVLPRPTPPHTRSIEPSYAPLSTDSSAPCCAGHNWVWDLFVLLISISSVQPIQILSLKLRAPFKGRGFDR